MTVLTNVETVFVFNTSPVLEQTQVSTNTRGTFLLIFIV